MAQEAYLRLVEAAYRVEASDGAWLRGLLDAAVPVLDMGQGVAALRYRATDDGGIDLLDIDGTGPIPIIEPDSRAYLDRSRGDLIGRMFCRTDAQFLRRDAAGAPSDNPEDFEYWKSRGVTEAFSVVGFDPEGLGVMIVALAPQGARIAPKKRGLLRGVAAHLASGARLRFGGSAARKDGDPANAVEAVLDAEGRVLDELGVGALGEARTALEEAGRTLGAVRARRLTEAEALDAWTALWAGRWTLVEKTEATGKTRLLARRNDPDLAEPKSLTPRERQVLAYARVGHAVKFIGFELGLSASTVAAHLASGMRKLGLKSRADLARLGGFEPDPDEE